MAVPEVHGRRDRLASWVGSAPTAETLALARAIGSLTIAAAADGPRALPAFTLDRDTIVVEANDALATLLDRPLDELVGRPPSFLVDHGLVPTRLLDHIARVGTAPPIRLQALDGRGRTIPLVVSMAAAHGPAHGPAPRLAVFCTDVSGVDPTHLDIEAEHDRWRLLLQHIADTITIVDDQLRVKEVATYDPDLLGRHSDDYVGSPGLDLLHPDDVATAAEVWAELLATPGNEARVTFRLRHDDGHFEHVEFGCVNLLDDPIVNGVLMTTRNVTRERANEALVAAQSEVLELIARDRPLDETLAAIARLVDSHTRGRSGILLLRDDARSLVVGAYGSVEPALLDLLRRAPMTPSPRLDTLDIRRPIVITDIEADVRTAPYSSIARAHGARSTWSMPIVENRSDELLGLIAVFDDERRSPDEGEREVGAVASHLAAIAIERSRAEDALAHQASHDQVTGLPNRTLLGPALESRLVRAHEGGTSVALLFVDIDRFKAVNDTFGHPGGDTLLLRFGRRLRTLVPESDFVGSFGGDEFVVVIERDDPLADAHAIGTRIDLALSEPFSLDEGEVFVSTSIGVATCDGAPPDDAAEAAASLLRDADMARSRAKELGRDRLELFDQPLRDRAEQRLRMDRELRRALEEDELVVHYQPTVDLDSGRVVGAEALLRWQHPTDGLLLPEQFLEVAEGSGTILRIGRLVLDRALAQARRWVDAERDLDGFAITVNLSAREVSAPGLATQVRRLLERHRWPADQLVLDLDERILVEDRETALRALEALKRIGVRLSIDDFGTGISSLSYMHRYPVDLVKIDPSFVRSLEADGTGSPVVNAVLHMAKALGLDVMAEGVEEEAQLAGLRLLGCRLAQGRLLADAEAPADAMPARLALP